MLFRHCYVIVRLYSRKPLPPFWTLIPKYVLSSDAAAPACLCPPVFREAKAKQPRGRTRTNATLFPLREILDCVVGLTCRNRQVSDISVILGLSMEVSLGLISKFRVSFVDACRGLPSPSRPCFLLSPAVAGGGFCRPNPISTRLCTESQNQYKHAHVST